MHKLKSFTDIHEALREFMPTPKQYEKARFSLEDMKKLLDFLGNPQEKLKVIHVAGTSGKTSTSYYMAALLQAAGKKVGLTVSPHVDEVNERVQVSLEPLPEKVFAREFQAFLNLVDESGIEPSYFAVILAFAYWYFAKEEIDYAVVEVGMGGLLDATNVVNRADKICVITDIDLDHTEFLGSSLAAIASQKAGIIHPHNPVFSYKQSEEVMNVLREICDQQQAELHEILTLKNASLPKQLPLFQRRNWYLAHKTFEFVSERDNLPGLGEAAELNAINTYVPARMETIEMGGKTLIMDGAHNAQKLQALFKSIKQRYPDDKIALLFSIVKTGGRRTQSTVETVVKFADHIVITSFYGEQDTPKFSVNPKQVAEKIHMTGFDDWEVIAEPEAAFRVLLKRPEKLLVVAGSFFLLNHIRPSIKR